MQRAPLYINLEKLAKSEGSPAQLFAQLAERLVYVPTLSGEGARRVQDGSFVFKVVQNAETREFLFFTTEKFFRTWAIACEFPTDCISLLGGDFCASIPEGGRVVVDAGQPHAVTLTSEQVLSIAAVQTGLDVAAAAVQSPVIGGAPLRMRGRSEPTSMAIPSPRARVSFADVPTFSSKTALLGDGNPEAGASPPRNDKLERKVILSAGGDANQVIRDEKKASNRSSLLKRLTGKE